MTTALALKENETEVESTLREEKEEEVEVETYEIADLFCGAGGTSEGARRVIEDELGARMELRAINHWSIAIETHQRNHPQAHHLVEDVSIVDPEAVVPEGYLDLLLASPECRFYSRARGGKPVFDQGRMNPWAVHRWLTSLNVRIALIENVPEFTEWGPLLPNGRPDKSRKGQYFQAWVKVFWELGYSAEWRMLNAANYGDATTRTRFFLMARRDGQPISWPEPTHARGDTGMFPGRKPWRPARDVIDWTNPGLSILDAPRYIRKPLSEKTRKRIARGLLKHGGRLGPLYARLLDLPGSSEPEGKAGYELREIVLEGTGENLPFILNRHGENGSQRAHSILEPTPTSTTRGAGYLVDAQARPFHGSDRQHTVPRSMGEPLHTITTLTGGGDYLVEAQAKPFLLGQQSGGAPRDTGEPAPTIASAGAISLVQPVVIHYYGQSESRELELPLSAITTCNKHALVQPLLLNAEALPELEKNGLAGPTLVEVNHAGERRNPLLADPLPTLTTKRTVGLANPAIIELAHGNGPQGDRGNDRRVHSTEDPLGSITTSPGLGLAQPNAGALLVQTSQTGGNGSYSKPADQPVPTLTTRNDVSVVTPTAHPFVVPNFGEREGQSPRVHDIGEPVPAVTSRGAGSLVTPMLSATELLERLQQDNIDPRRLALINGQPFILDIRFRMLMNSELARAMGFTDEEYQYEFAGNTTQVTKQIGNAVPVRLATALVREALLQGRRKEPGREAPGPEAPQPEDEQ